MTNNQLPRTIAPDEVQVGDRIRLERAIDGITYTETLTVARIKGWKLLSPEGGSTYIIKATETVTLLDRPEPEPEWITDGICVDENGDTWALYSGEWYYPGTDGYSAKELQIAHGPISRHPAVIAAEKRGEQRVLDAVREVLKPGRHCDSLAAAQDLVDGWTS